MPWMKDNGEVIIVDQYSVIIKLFWKIPVDVIKTPIYFSVIESSFIKYKASAKLVNALRPSDV